MATHKVKISRWRLIERRGGASLPCQIKLHSGASCGVGGGITVQFRDFRGTERLYLCKRHARLLHKELGEVLDAWQDMDRCWQEVDRQNECRYDCIAVPG